MKNLTLFFILFIFLLIKSFHLLAAPNSGSLLHFENELNNLKELPKIIPKETNVINGEPIQNGGRILVKGFRLVGKKNGISDEELLEILEEEVDKELTFSEIQLVAKRVQDFYRNKGYFLAQAFIPEQEVKEGIIEIFISEGNLEVDDPVDKGL